MLARAPRQVATPADFATQALAALLSGGGELVQDRRPMATGRLRYVAARRSTGSVLVEVAESPWAGERDVIESAETLLWARGFRARAFAGASKLLIAAPRRARRLDVVAPPAPSAVAEAA